uniref:Putative transcriptional regulator n=1 Tax=termite gut metagenome TaxID=433724 RepID=S0DGE1_9ZZZZ
MFHENTKMADVVLTNSRLFSILPYFGIELGFGEKSVRQVCAERGVSAPLVLLVCNIYTFDDWSPEPGQLRQVPVEGIVDYLERSHRDYLEVRMPRITDAVLGLAGEIVGSFFEKYRQEVVAHFRYEEEVVFPYIRQLLDGGKGKPDYRISEYESNHSDIDAALEDLKNIIIKYLPREYTLARCHPVLVELFEFEFDLRKHTRLEDDVLIPLVQRIDTAADGAVKAGNGADGHKGGIELSEREKETLAALARGLSNKEIADRLFISTHTVISHRKNIVRKTGIKTVSGLTLYALFNNLVSQDDLR